ncbi:MAG TPA: hypothetical protein VFS21_03375 [Roseiflexaceae bacterium]|nr:hypothetical protein [Roseiflexaceae bacterium]
MQSDDAIEERAIWKLEECGLRAVGSRSTGYQVRDHLGAVVASAPDLAALRRLADERYVQRWTGVRRVEAA